MSNQNESKGKSIAKGTLIYAIGNLGTKIITFLIVPLYTYFITTEEMGDYDLVLTTVNLLAPLVTLRVSDAAYRWMLHKLEPIEKCISNTYIVLFFTSAITAFLLCFINSIKPITYFNYFILILIIGRWQETLQFLLRGLNNQKLYAISGIIYTLIYCVLNVVQIVVLNKGVDALFQSTIISEIIVIFILLIFEPKLRTIDIIHSKDYKFIRMMLKYSLPLIPSGLCWWVMSSSDRYVIRAFLGRGATGIFAVANKFPTIIATIFTIFNYSWTDVAMGSIKEGQEMSSYSSKLFENLYVFSFSFVMPLIPITKIISTTILSESYKSASVYIAFLYLGSLFQGFTAFISAGMLQKNDTKLIARSSSIGALVNLVFDIIAIQYIGLQAASISTFLGGFVMWICRINDSKTISPIYMDWEKFGFLLGGSVILSTLCIWTDMTIDLILSLVFTILFIVLNKSMIRSLSEKVLRGE